jgi:hypothetical protein
MHVAKYKPPSWSQNAFRLGKRGSRIVEVLEDL